MNEIKETYVMQLPHSRDDLALEFWKKQIILFKEKLESFCTEHALSAATRRQFQFV